MEFYYCSVCGNLVVKIEDGGNTPTCCNRQMTHLQSESTDGAHEKHVPVFSEIDIKCSDISLKKVTVKVGSEPHPMEASHFIKWIAIETSCGQHILKLKPGDSPEAVFHLDKCEKLLRIYEYCNLHGLWVKEV